MTYSLIWIPAVLRQAGLTVVEEPGWESRGHGDFGPAKGVLIHHTASNREGGNNPDLNMVINGRADPPLAGPLCNLLVARDGTFHCIAAGHANHAGKGLWHGIVEGNSELVGIEAENDGLSEPWPELQLDPLARGSAALLAHMNADSVMCAGHKEYALPRGRKVDPDFDMIAFRERVGNLMAAPAGTTTPVVPVVTTDPTRSMLRKGDQGQSVAMLQRLLGLPGDGYFGPITDTAVRQFQSSHGLKVDGLVGPATWKALGY